MQRAVSLLIVLAHVCVITIPCFDADLGLDTFQTRALPQPHAVVQQPAPSASHHAHHSPAPASAHAQHGGGHHRNLATPSKPHVKVAGLELRAQCKCGCSKTTNSTGTTTSPRVGFALLAPEPIRFAERVPSFDVASTRRWPVPIASAFDHVPILS